MTAMENSPICRGFPRPFEAMDLDDLGSTMLCRACPIFRQASLGEPAKFGIGTDQKWDFDHQNAFTPRLF